MSYLRLDESHFIVSSVAVDRVAKSLQYLDEIEINLGSNPQLMDDLGLSVQDLYPRCCDRVLADAKTSMSFQRLMGGGRKSGIVFRDALNRYSGKREFPDDYFTRLIEAERIDVKEFVFMKGTRQYDPERFEVCLDSFYRSLDVIADVVSKTEGKLEEQLDFLRYILEHETELMRINQDRMKKNSDRVERLYDSNNPEDAFPPLREQFMQNFEEIYIPISSEIQSIVKHYPGISSNDAYRITEDILSFRRSYGTGSDLKSDLRYIRNHLAHSNYSEDESIRITISESEAIELDMTSLSATTAFMSMKCGFVNMLLPLMNIEVLRRIGRTI